MFVYVYKLSNKNFNKLRDMARLIAVAMLDKKLTAAERDILNELKDVLDIEISY